MPDRKTMYIAEDGTNMGMYKFVAKKAEDLTEGGCSFNGSECLKHVDDMHPNFVTI